MEIEFRIIISHKTDDAKIKKLFSIYADFLFYISLMTL